MPVNHDPPNESIAPPLVQIYNRGMDVKRKKPRFVGRWIFPLNVLLYFSAQALMVWHLGYIPWTELLIANLFIISGFTIWIIVLSRWLAVRDREFRAKHRLDFP